MNYEPDSNRAAAMERVKAPAIALMVVAGLSVGFSLLALLANLLGTGFNAANMGRYGGDQQMFQVMSGAVGIIMAILWVIVDVVIFLGAMKMKALQSWGFAMASAILAIIPCLGGHPCCCFLGLPVGIWALIVLLKPEVKAAFQV
ncbi:MAG: hypothetical protein IPQ13_11030 [Holophagaceae bacterium]|nr:hypothetical protein [Holophagaceae bacterium]